MYFLFSFERYTLKAIPLNWFSRNLVLTLPEFPCAVRDPCSVDHKERSSLIYPVDC